MCRAGCGIRLYRFLGPVVQSIVSLTKSLSLLVRLKSSVLIFIAEKCEELAPHISSAKQWQCFLCIICLKF